ncbi:MAG TPA: GlsB/YeaQ/YmgE family stress response membrane protein [Verrucomicrobiae bacterium]|nr:GlsB/YeaQ/YmgE family stress response membrane protein [Verrucomicrobiae bacterium]
MENWLWFILIGLAAGFLAGIVIKGHGFGILGNIIVGIIGALLGGFLFRLLGLSTTGRIGELLCAFVGTILLLFLLKFVKRKGA